MIDGGGSSICESCDVQRKDGKVGREGGVDVEKEGKRKRFKVVAG